jgi:hypothetical protein
MKKIFSVLIVAVCFASLASGQTNSEITNILNTKGISITTTSATANNSNLFSVDLLTTGATYRMIDITITGTWVATVSFQGSNDNFTTVDAIPVYEVTSASNAAVTTTAANGTFQINTGGWRYIRVRTTAFTSGTVASVAYGYLNNVNFVNRSVAATIQNSSLAVTNIGTFATQAAQSGTWNIGTVTTLTGITNALPAGTNLLGKIGIDQTTVGTTNAVSLAQLGANTIATGNGASSTGVLRVAQVNDGTGVLATVTSLTQFNGNAIALNTGTRSAGTLRVTIATDDIVPASQSGTWTMQPGNTANTTAWMFKGNKLEDDASANADPGLPLLAVQKATPANTAGTDGDYEFLQMSGGRLWASATIDAALPTGTNSIGKISDITASITPGTGASNLGKAEDAAHTSADVGVMSLGVRKATPTDLASADGDYEPFQVGATGALWVAGVAETKGGWSVATGSIGATKTDIGTANTTGQVGGWYFYNPNSSVAYVQFFNTQASGVTLGTTAPVYSLGIPATSGANVSPGMVGLAHSTAICIAITTTRTGSTGPSSTVDYNIWYKQ